MGQQWMDVVANNLANISTHGFKEDRIAFEQSFAQELRSHAGGGPLLGELSAGTRVVGTFTNHTKGNVLQTGNPLDLAIDGERGMFAVQTPQGVQYTRDGSFTRNEEGRLVNRTGLPVLGADGRPIDLPKGSVSFGANGQIVDRAGESRQVGVFEGSFQKVGTNLYSATGEVEEIETPRVISAALESSNVDPVGTMVQMIQVQRIYEMAQRSVQQQDESTQQLIQRISQG